MMHSLERDSLLTFPMVAYELEKVYTNNTRIELKARFNYQEDNIYFFEKYVNQEYENPDGIMVTWYELSQYRDLRDDEMSLLHELEHRKLISELEIEQHPEEDYAETGRPYDRPTKYRFVAQNGYIEALREYQSEADQKLYFDAELEFTGILSPLLRIGPKTVKLRAINTEPNSGKIIEYCSEHSMDKAAKLEDLKKELSISGVSDIKTSLRGTVFYPGGTLEDFIEVNASRILLKSKGRILFANFKSMKIAE